MTLSLSLASHQVLPLRLPKLSQIFLCLLVPHFASSWGSEELRWFPYLESRPPPLLAGFLNHSLLKFLPCLNPPTTTPFRIKPKFHMPGFLHPHGQPQPASSHSLARPLQTPAPTMDCLQLLESTSAPCNSKLSQAPSLLGAALSPLPQPLNSHSPRRVQLKHPQT